MPQPTTREVHFDTVLTNVSIAYKQSVQGLIADRVFPIVPVEKQSDKILKFSKEYWLRIQAGLRAPGTESRGGGFALDSTSTYFADIHAFHVDAPWAMMKNSDVPDMERQIVEFVTWQLLLERERDWAFNFFDPTGKTEDVDFWTIWEAPGDFTAWDQSGSDPIKDILAAKNTILKRTGFMPNKMVIGPGVLQALKTHTAIQSQVVYSPASSADVKGLVTPELLAKLFDLDAVYVGMQPYDSGAEGAALSPSFIFPNHVLLVYAPPRPGVFVPTGGYIFEWTGYNSGYAVGISAFDLEHLKATRYEGEMAYDCKLLGPDLGILLKSVVT